MNVTRFNGPAPRFRAPGVRPPLAFGGRFAYPPPQVAAKSIAVPALVRTFAVPKPSRTFVATEEE